MSEKHGKLCPMVNGRPELGCACTPLGALRSGQKNAYFCPRCSQPIKPSDRDICARCGSSFAVPPTPSGLNGPCGRTDPAWPDIPPCTRRLGHAGAHEAKDGERFRSWGSDDWRPEERFSCPGCGQEHRCSFPEITRERMGQESPVGFLREALRRVYAAASRYSGWPHTKKCAAFEGDPCDCTTGSLDDIQAIVKTALESAAGIARGSPRTNTTPPSAPIEGSGPENLSLKEAGAPASGTECEAAETLTANVKDRRCLHSMQDFEMVCTECFVVRTRASDEKLRMADASTAGLRIKLKEMRDHHAMAADEDDARATFTNEPESWRNRMIGRAQIRRLLVSKIDALLAPQGSPDTAAKEIT